MKTTRDRSSTGKLSEVTVPEGPCARGAVTSILAEVQSQGPKAAMERLLPLIYEELRVLARAQMRHERSGHTLQTTAIVHEAYLRLLGGQEIPWTDRKHFFCAAAQAMRHILVDHARSRGRIKRGGARVRVRLTGLDLGFSEDCDQILALDEALQRLEEQDARAADVVRMRFFAGLDVEETANALKVSPRTVKREWAFARAWLYDRLKRAD
jgi:RNA polymerase sigma-70 factor (ECF subfamily)